MRRKARDHEGSAWMWTAGLPEKILSIRAKGIPVFEPDVRPILSSEIKSNDKRYKVPKPLQVH